MLFFFFFFYFDSSGSKGSSGTPKAKCGITPTGPTPTPPPPQVCTPTHGHPGPIGTPTHGPPGPIGTPTPPPPVGTPTSSASTTASCYHYPPSPIDNLMGGVDKNKISISCRSVIGITDCVVGNRTDPTRLNGVIQRFS